MPDPVDYKVVDQTWDPSDPTAAETMLNDVGAQGWSLASVYPDPQREKTRWIFSQGPTGTSGGGVAPTAPFQEVVLGHVKGVDYNTVGNTPIPIASSKYVPMRGISVNNVGGGDMAGIAVLTTPGPGGDDLGLGFYTEEGVVGNWPVSGGIPIRTGDTLYLYVWRAEGVPATGDIYILGYDLDGVSA